MTGIVEFSGFSPFFFASLFSLIDVCMFCRFLELGSILEPGRPPKMDKAVILGDAVRMVTQLRMEAQKLKESNENLKEKINDLKVSLRLIIVHFYGSMYSKVSV